MTNLEVQNNIYTFSINGGDLKTTKIALYGPIICIILPAFTYWAGVSPYLVPEIIPAHVNTWIVFAFILIGLAGAFFLIKKLDQGNYTRYEVRINKNTDKISAYDRQRDQHLWEEKFHPKYLYTSTINVIISDEEFEFPTLVYAEERMAQVEEGIPYPDLSVLGYGEETDITKVLQQLKDDESNIDM